MSKRTTDDADLEINRKPFTSQDFGTVPPLANINPKSPQREREAQEDVKRTMQQQKEDEFFSSWIQQEDSVCKVFIEKLWLLVLIYLCVSPGRFVPRKLSLFFCSVAFSFSFPDVLHDHIGYFTAMLNGPISVPSQASKAAV
jgi:hypothetical protein